MGAEKVTVPTPAATTASAKSTAPVSGSSGASKGSVVFTPLYGCDEGTPGVGPVSSILEVGGVTILLDCGWDIHFETSLLEPLREVVNRVDLVLISHPDLEHLGVHRFQQPSSTPVANGEDLLHLLCRRKGLPYAFGKLGLRANVYTTLPVWKMGQMTVYDAFLSRSHEGKFEAFDLDDVDSAFARFKTLKYSQHLKFSDRGAGVTIVPYAAGRMIGAAVWRVSWQTEDNDIVYATAYNHKPERHLRPSALSSLTRPSVFITDAHNALTEVKSRKFREDRLLSVVMDTVRGGGNILLPTDTAGRVLELLVLLNDYWQKHRLGSYKLVLLHNTAFNTAEFAKSQLEWMSDDIGRAFDLQRSNPFELRNVHIIHSLEELDELGDEPRALLLRWASKRSNTILLTGRGHGDSTARSLLAQLEVRERAAAARKRKKLGKKGAKTPPAAAGSSPGENAEDGDGVEEEEAPIRLSVKVPIRVPLAGEELKAFREEENRKRRLEAEEEEQRRQAAAMEKEQVMPDSDDEGDGGTTGAGEGSTAGGPSAESTAKRRRTIVASLFSKYSKPQHLMFGYYDPQVPMDEYGVKETEQIGWLAAAMQQHNSEIPAAMEEAGAALQHEARGKLKDRDRDKAEGGEDAEKGEEGEKDDERGDSLGNGAAGGAGALSQAQGPVDALRAGAAGGKESAFFQDSGAVPTKLEQEDQEVEVLCRVVYVDSEGLADGRSIKNMVQTLAPKMLIVMGGTRRAKASLISHVRKQLDGDNNNPAAAGGDRGESGDGALTSAAGAGMGGKAEAPRYVVVRKVLEPLPVGLDAGACDVLLHDSLHTQLKWKQLKQYGVAHMECRVDPRGRLGGTPLLCAKPRGERSGHPAMFLSVGNVSVMHFQQALVSAGINVEFVSGTLLCEGVVTLRPGEGGKMDLEGPIGDTYFRVREVVYQQYTII